MVPRQPMGRAKADGDVVAGVDFGTFSVRVTLFCRGRQGARARQSPNIRCTGRDDDPDHATQSHDDQMTALASAIQKVLTDSGVAGTDIAALAIDTTGSSVIMVGEGLQPLGDYYLWCDHRAKAEAQEITELAHQRWAGGDRLVRRRLFP